MKKASKILTLILIVVFVFSVFAGCSLIGRDVAKYRSTLAMKVGEQEITIGKLLDTFNTYYNNYGYLVNAGYYTVEGLFEMAMNSLLRQYIQIDDYVTRHKDDGEVINSTFKDVDLRNVSYLNGTQLAYCIKYVLHTSYTTFDSTVIDNLSVKHEIGEAEAEDTSRDFTEWDDLKGASTYAEYVFNKNFEDEDADEYFDKYYSYISFSTDSADNVSKLIAMLSNLTGNYVYPDEYEDEATEGIIKELNDRLEEDEEPIDFKEYQTAQRKALEQFADVIKSNYGITLQQFMINQVEDMVSSCILAMWSYEQYKDIDVTEDVAETDRINSNAQKVSFAINNNFDSFITGLSNSSYIYSVPEDKAHDYVFVKNILIPFTARQSSWLNAQSGKYGGTDSEAFIELRNETAAQITAEYFYSDKYDQEIEDTYFAGYLEPTDPEKDTDSKYKKLDKLFKFDSSSRTLSIDETGVLAQFFKSGNTVQTMSSKNESETIVELMKRFNTDVGQHTNRYDYVVYVGADWETYNHNWVKEFYTAVNELRDGDTFNGVGKYAMCVSTYGVHIIYVEGYVDTKIYNPGSSWTDTTSLNYVRYKDAFSTKQNKATKDAFEALEADYINESKITINSQFERFLKDNGMDFDFDEFLEEILSELNVKEEE